MASIADAHAALLRNGAFQFDFPAGATPKPESAPWHLPEFGDLHAVGFLVVLAVAAVLVTVLVYLRNRPAVAEAVEAAGPVPVLVPAVARAALGDADALAARGCFLDAAHTLLACGLGTIAEHHPGLMRPTTTSRDLAAAPALPTSLRGAFGRIAAAVEKGLFGGRTVGAEDYAECRRVFVASALAGRG